MKEKCNHNKVHQSQMTKIPHLQQQWNPFLLQDVYLVEKLAHFNVNAY